MNIPPELRFDSEPHELGPACICVDDLDQRLISSLHRRAQPTSVLRPILRVRVAGPEVPGDEALPDILGRYQVLERGIRFIPRFPFEPGIRYRASFDPRPLGVPELSEMVTLEFSLPEKLSAESAQVEQVFPSSDSLPENLLRLYVRFSSSMQRGVATEHVSILGPDGQPALDVLYRPPVELWDRSMQLLTVLLDPGRLKRWVGPNRELGPPLSAGLDYTLVVASGMRAASGRPLAKSFYKAFHVTEPVRETVQVDRWAMHPPPVNTRRPLVLLFPRPLDWALLCHVITVESEGGRPVPGRITIDRYETRWRFTPALPWAAGSYRVHVTSELEDVCGNNLLAPFDRPLRSRGDLSSETPTQSLSFRIAH
jgi:hypothetical protein